MKPVAVAMLCVIGAIGCGCASHAVIVSSASLWPFQRLEIRTTQAGVVTAYISRPEDELRRLVVVLQSPLCQPDVPSANETAISTAGVLWERFAKDSAFVQFERPIGRRAASEEPAVQRVDCKAGSSDEDLSRAWARTVNEVVGVLRKQESLQGLPTLYLGFDRGALPAADLAVKDRHATALAFVSARIPEEASMRTGVPVVIVQGLRDEAGLVESANSLYSRLSQQGQPVSMLTFSELGHDLGLSDDKPECFEKVMDALASQLLAFTDDRERRRSDRQELDCPDIDVVEDPSDPVIEALPR